MAAVLSASRFSSSSCALCSACRSIQALRRSSKWCSDNTTRLSRHGSLATAAGRRDELMRGVDSANKEDVARILELAERAADSWQIITTSFYTPPVVADALDSISRMADVAAVPWGGFPQAERCRIAVGRSEALAAAQENPSQLEGIAAVECRGNFLFDKATHRDFLGACLGTGIERDTVGDIILQGEAGAQILTMPNLVVHLEAELTQVRSVPVLTKAIGLDQLRVQAPRGEEMTTVEASLRLDAVASAGFRMSRSKMADLCKAGDVRLNWRSGSKASTEVKQGDVISCAGKGRLKVEEAGVTQKGKYRLRLVRYI